MSNTPTVRVFPATHDAVGNIGCEGMPLPSVCDFVLAGNVAVIQGAVDKKKALNIRDEVYRWGQKQPLRARGEHQYHDDNHHAINSGISERQKTPHHYHAYNFNALLELEPADLRASALEMFDAMRGLWCGLTGNTYDFSPDAEGRKFHPQVIHYPSGGGYFGKHIHALLPQKVGIILGLSERGSDFKSGCTRFEIDGTELDTEEVHDVGDIIIFRYDVVHWISPIDPEDTMDESSCRGRWTMVLPYY